MAFARFARACALAVALIGGAITGARADEAPAPLAPALPRAPLAGPLSLTDGYGSVRSDHFHAGLDFSTGGRVGAEVFAPLPGTVVRVRASGAGYGRSLYLKCDDGRTLVFGHLDAFAPPLAAFVDSIQRASARYEQDLTPPPGMFRFNAGDRIAWTGESGVGGPHLHLEIRHNDFALDPLRAGITMSDKVAPVLDALTLEPLEAGSYVMRRASPYTLPLTRDDDTLLVLGRVRAAVRARDGGLGASVAPWSVAMRFQGVTTEARFDSISWDGEMSQSALLLDRGRIAGGAGIILYAPEGPRPRFIRSEEPAKDPAGVITVQAGDPPRELRLIARDAAGNTTQRRVWLRGPRANESAADTASVHGDPKANGAPRWSFAALPGKWIRVRVTNTPAGLHDVRIERAREGEDGRAATWDGSGWCAIVRGRGIPDDDGFWIKAKDASGRNWWQRGAYVLWPLGADLPIDQSAQTRIALQPMNVFEAGVGLGRSLPPEECSRPGLTALTPVVEIAPSDWPLREPAELSLVLPDGMSGERAGVYHRSGSGDEWDWVPSDFDSTAHKFVAEVRELGQIALMRDTAPPALTLRAVPRVIASTLPYSRWALEAGVSDAGSGLDTDRSAISVDGARVPTEYDRDARVLRWRPRTPPSAGSHRYEVVAVDRAGNRTKAAGVFVIDSPRRR